MRIIIVRHGDPNYDLDCLTERGIKEAESLIERFKNEKIDFCFKSPLGRAQETCEIAMGHDFPKTTYEWLQEFIINVPNKPDGDKYIPWDFLPQDWANEEILYDKNHWFEHKYFKDSKVKEYYQHVISQFDKLLAEHHYIRNGNLYNVETEKSETLIFFCHLGLECVLLSHLLNVSPIVLMHNTCPLTSSVTTLYSEERVKGIASFRATQIADISHLYKNNLEPNFSARFCEMFADNTRH